MKGAIRQLIYSAGGKSAGRNSSGRITIFHRGGGSKRLQRRIDLKRSTSSMGIVERVEYDPNRSSRIALVRWIEGQGISQSQTKLNTNAIEEFALPPPPSREIVESTTTTSTRGLFSFSSMPGMSLRSKSAAGSNKKACASDVFLSALSSPKTKGETETLPLSFRLPRVAVAGAKPAFFAERMREQVGGKDTFSLPDARKWRTPQSMKRNAALSWHSFTRQDTLGVVGAVKQKESKGKNRGKHLQSRMNVNLKSQELFPFVDHLNALKLRELLAFEGLIEDMTPSKVTDELRTWYSLKLC